ncbi:pyridoxal phosphate-dependent aminotransferase [Desulfotalea psychrophila]|nr:pyridoxal phosphate-dependent aminotransferase [Desulfotalea psychrophila]
MRTDIVHIGAGELTYEIRNIVEVGQRLQRLGVEVNWENIGDPIAKGEEVPSWMKALVAEAVQDDASYGYSPTKGVLATRRFIAAETNKKGAVQISAEDIIFFNGLGDAISKIFGFLKRTARVLVPTPSYTTHSSAEAAHSGDKPLTYKLDPHNDWYPDIADIERRVKYNPMVAGILIINPDNPTGAVYPVEILRAIVDIARRYDLFLICDEVYQNIIYNGKKTASLAEVIGEVPGFAMRGASKEMPWPGARCGWIEVYNADRDPMFQRYIDSIFNAKMLEVCSTTLPQIVYPRVVTHAEYPGYLQSRIARYQRFSKIAYDCLKDIEGILVNQANGAFYMSVCFEDGVLNSGQSLAIARDEVRTMVEDLVFSADTALDKRFVYYLLGATGVCVVPLTSFASDINGFRVTLLERDEAEFIRIFTVIAAAIRTYLKS